VDGDRALRLFARALHDSVRRIDRAARIDGEEFAVILPDTEAHSAYLLAERLRARIAQETPADPIELSASLGVVSCPKHGITSEELMHHGERALLAAKILGGDRAVMYDAEIVGSLIAGEGRRELRREENIAAVMVLAETLDLRDSGTALHSQTVARYASLIARELGLDDGLVERLRVAGVLHDIGKIGVQDSILRKAGALTDAEYAEMQRHAELGARILAGANLDDISEWVLAHHERPDGRGYPHGLGDHEIPLEAKILAVADSYEAMTSDRVYRLALGHEAAQEELRRCAGSQFDRDVVEALIAALAAQPVAA
jgi:putative nucleotidyltransferase with HDIG domain